MPLAKARGKDPYPNKTPIRDTPILVAGLSRRERHPITYLLPIFGFCLSLHTPTSTYLSPPNDLPFLPAREGGTGGTHREGLVFGSRLWVWYLTPSLSSSTRGNPLLPCLLRPQ